MGLFDKKFCDVCGEKIGLLGNRKLEDGNLCKNCAKKLSPWFDDRRHSTLAQIKDQLAYREHNEEDVANFNITRTFGDVDLVCLDEGQRKFLIAKTNDISSENPDVLDYSQITSCELDIDKREEEDKRTDNEGHEVSYNPPRYRYEYNFYLDVKVNHPWFDDMRIPLNRSNVEVIPQAGARFFNSEVANNMSGNAEYQKYVDMAQEIKNIIFSRR